ncbi:MAG: ATP-dependent DNA helicase [Thiotrichales bacterium]
MKQPDSHDAGASEVRASEDSELEEVFGVDGPLSEALKGYQPRTGQIELAQAVEKTLVDRGLLVAEAGTGIGKTFAYLVPALLSGQKIMVSTGTKHLQDQLFKKDLPLLLNALKLQCDAVLLKGRSNYLCIYRLEQSLKSLAQNGHRDFMLLNKLDDWRKQTQSGDRVEFSEIPEDHAIWIKVTSTADNCLGQECKDYRDCFVVKARRAAQDADLVVVNHHLFCADLALRETGFGELLPLSEGVIIDEAHQLPEVALNFFGDSISSRQLIELGKDIVAEALNEAPDMLDLREQASNLPVAVNRFRLALGKAGQRAAWLPMLGQKSVSQALSELLRGLSELAAELEVGADRGPGLQSCFRRLVLLRQLVVTMSAEEEERIQWFETSRLGFMLRLTPFEIADRFQQHTERLNASWVFTSATLAVGDDFSHFTSRLGLNPSLQGQWASPFDYQNNMLLLLPEAMPLPSEPQFTGKVVELALKLVEHNNGGTFLLFTSYRALREAEQLLRLRTHRRLLVQGGETTKQALLEEFRAAGDAVLLGTSGFWEGVDVRGEALRCVVIDKLPFASPGDPVMEARFAAMRRQGRNPFSDFQLPQAVIALKQGAGRLIRDETDCGLLVVCDPRVRSKSYGRTFLSSLPPAPVTDDADTASFFLADC